MRSAPVLRDLCDVRHGGTPSKTVETFWSGEIPWISPKDMKKPEIADAKDHISLAAVENSATSVVPAGTVLVVVRSGILAHSVPIAKALRPVAFNQDIKALIPKSPLVEPDYLFWFLRAQEPNIVTRGVKKGATVHSVRSGFIENLVLPVPSRDSQRRAVGLLSSAERIVRLRLAAQAKASELIPALFVDLFGDPGANSRGWDMTTIGNTVAAADYGTSKKALEDGAGTAVIRMGNVDYAGDLDLHDLKYVELSPEEVTRWRLEPGDILFNRTNSKDLVGKTGLWDRNDEAVAASYFIRVRVDRQCIRPFFFWAFMNTAHMKRRLFDTARGAIGQANINTKELKAFPIFLPPIDRQADFEARARDILGIRAQQSAALAKAEATLDALMSRIFGDLSARDAEGAACVRVVPVCDGATVTLGDGMRRGARCERRDGTTKPEIGRPVVGG